MMSQSYGPFHRKKSPTQTYATACLQEASSEVWGRPHRLGGLFPTVKAFALPLCAGAPAGLPCSPDHGIEFETSVRPSQRLPNGLVLWTLDAEPMAGLRRVDDETIALSVTLNKVHYPETEG